MKRKKVKKHFMNIPLGRSLVLMTALATVGPGARATTVSIDTTAANSLLRAISNPSLTEDQATAVVQMKGNQAIIRKLQEFDIPASTFSFARALYAEAHGKPITDRVGLSYSLDEVKGNIGGIRMVITSIERDPDHFQRAIERRIARFSPRSANIHINGYVVAGGDGGGYTFGDTDFYLNVGRIRDFVLAREVTNHEMYHAVQGAFSKERGALDDDPDLSPCHATRKLFDNLYEEGTADYVGDHSLIDQAKGEAADRIRDDERDGLKHMEWSASLLEMSVDALNAKTPLPYSQVYAVGFYGHAILYNIAYVIAKDITARYGPDGLIKLLRQPSYDYILTYVRLPEYGKDRDHPPLGNETVAAAQRLAAGCK